MTYRIERTDNNQFYRFDLVQDFDDTLEQMGIPLPIPGNQPQDSFIFPLSAQTGEAVLEWFIHNNGEDRSENDSGFTTTPQDGTFADTDSNGAQDVTTIIEQKKWLKDYIFNGDLGVQYKIYGDDLPSAGLNVSARNLRIRKRVDRPNEYLASITLTVGKVL